jgi:hypothetical protein
MSARNPFSAIFNHYQFPLAVLKPNASSIEPISVSLRGQNRTDIPYDCISYDRSKEFASSKILLEDEEIEMPEPLVTALRALRKPSEPRLLWTDVLLGRTLQQQNEQAAVAKTIIQNAKSTIAWLGPRKEQTEEVFKILKTLAIWWHQAAVRTNFPSNFAHATTTQMNDVMAYFASQDPSKLRPNEEMVWEAMLAVFQSPYFDSVQTIADVILSEEVIVTSGESSISWPDFMAAFRGLVVAMPRLLNKLPSVALQDSFSRVSQIEIAHRRYREDPGLELLPMIQTAGNMLYTDPREIVFSMLPLARPSKRTEVTGRKIPMPIADYSKTPQEIFIQAAKFVIEERQDLILWWAERPPNGRRMENLPSWVPDWTTKLPTEVVRISVERRPSLRHWSESIRSTKTITVIDNRLHLQAHKLDCVQSVSRMFTQENCRRLALEEWQRLPKDNQNQGKRFTQLWRTLILNVGGTTTGLRDQAPPSKDMWTSFQSILAEERITELMHCTLEELMNDSSILARARADPQCQILGPQTGKSEAYELLLQKNAIGRRFFTTENGRMGMTAFEETPESKDGDQESKAKIAAALNQMPTESDPFGFGDAMMSSFQGFLNQRDTRSAAAFAQMMEQKEKTRGVKVGDVVVAVVGGDHPYVMRNVSQSESSEGEIGGKEFRFIGDCYLHGVMAGEPFTVQNWLGASSWRTDVVVEDIKVV